ncbi:MAG: hypothetical protein DRJ10_07545 [Bacteroidetes bacterium]|nr:MAG: hypothetical protein DRJ10_07545 [Bacteroidota bacterium]
MKKLLLIVSIIISGLFFTNNLKAQECDFYFPVEKGTVVETTSYDKKNKETDKYYQEVLDYSKNNGITEVKIETRLDEEGVDTLGVHQFSVRCENGEFYVNMGAYVDKNSMSAYQGMDMEVDTDNMTMPSNLSAGQTLNDGRVSIKISNSGVKMMTLTVNITNRKVEGFEKITTPAGTFDCVKISFDSDMKMIFKIKTSSVQWFAKDIGIVKSENYDEKGKLTGTSMITKITK